MRILLVTRASPFRGKDQPFFRKSYGGVDVSPQIAGTFGWFWEKALKQLGHQVRPFVFYRGPGLFESRLKKFARRVKAGKGFRRTSLRRMNRELLGAASGYRPDIVLVDGGELITPETIGNLKHSVKSVTVLWLLDHPRHQGWHNVLQSMPIYDLVFTFDPEYVHDFREMGAEKVECLPCACDADIHRSYALSREETEELGTDLCFVGAITESRRDFLLRLANQDLSIWGWNREAIANEPRLMQKYRGVTYGEGLARVYNASRITLNVHHPQTRAGLNMRTFEAAGCGAFQLVDLKPSLSRHFSPGQEIISYNSHDELLELIKYYLVHHEEREEIAARAQARAHGSHTYLHRMQALLDMVETL